MDKFKRNQPILHRNLKGHWETLYFYMQRGEWISYKTSPRLSFTSGQVSASRVVDGRPFETGLQYGAEIDSTAVMLDKIAKLEDRRTRYEEQIEELRADIEHINREIDTLKKSID